MTFSRINTDVTVQLQYFIYFSSIFLSFSLNPVYIHSVMFTIQEGAAETFRDQQGFSDPDSEEDKLRSQNWTF